MSISAPRASDLLSIGVEPDDDIRATAEADDVRPALTPGPLPVARRCRLNRSMPDTPDTLGSAKAPVVEIYTRPMCMYCYRALRLLESKGVEIVEHNVWRDRARSDECRARLGGRHTYPQVFIRGQAVGGFTDLAELERVGELDGLIGG